MSECEMVREFMLKFERPVDVKYNRQDAVLCYDLIEEEWGEVMDEFETERFSLERLTKELCDLLYVTYYTANKFGLPIEEAFKRVHQSNMSKLDDNGKPILNDVGKILKGPNYKPADLSDLFP